MPAHKDLSQWKAALFILTSLGKKCIEGLTINSTGRNAQNQQDIVSKGTEACVKVFCVFTTTKYKMALAILIN